MRVTYEILGCANPVQRAKELGLNIISGKLKECEFGKVLIASWHDQWSVELGLGGSVKVILFMTYDEGLAQTGLLYYKAQAQSYMDRKDLLESINQQFSKL